MDFAGLIIEDLTVIIPLMLPFDSKPGKKAVRDYWASGLMRDPILLQSAITHSALHLDKVYRKQTTALSAMHIRHTINLINKRLGANPPNIDDELIVAVAMFSTNSVRSVQLAELSQ